MSKFTGSRLSTNIEDRRREGGGASGPVMTIPRRIQVIKSLSNLSKTMKTATDKQWTSGIKGVEAKKRAVMRTRLRKGANPWLNLE